VRSVKKGEREAAALAEAGVDDDEDDEGGELVDEVLPLSFPNRNTNRSTSVLNLHIEYTLHIIPVTLANQFLNSLRVNRDSFFPVATDCDPAA